MIEEEHGALYTFIRLASSDHIESTIIPELLWVLGYSMAAPILADEVMHTILRIYDNSCDSKQHQTSRAEAAHIADLQAPARSKLNRFVMDYVASFGPSQILESDYLETSSDYVTDWQVFIHGGGDLVWFIRSESDFKTENNDKYAPFYPRVSIQVLDPRHFSTCPTTSKAG
ncbi:hypothetical protein WAI453_001049 [Rhynchosporium graminicola]